MSAERGHILTVRESDDHSADCPDYLYDIECVAPEKCGGWQECLEPHEVDGCSANDGPWNCDDDAPWYELEEFTFHGVGHEWRYGWGWTVPFPGCVVAANDAVVDDAHDIGRERGPGRYVVDDDWDDTTCYLTMIEAVS